MSTVQLALSLVIMLAGARAWAEDADATNTITVVGEPVTGMDYAKVYGLADKIKQTTNGRVALAVALKPQKDGVSMDNIKISIVDDDGNREEGRHIFGSYYLIPVSSEIFNKHGRLVVNRKRGSLEGYPAIVPNVNPAALKVADIQLLLADMDKAMSQFPWYMRMFSSNSHTIDVCTFNAGRAVYFQGGDGNILGQQEISKRDDGMSKLNAHETLCTQLNGKENYPADARIVVPEGASLF